jgi:hypothetical protein
MIWYRCRSLDKIFLTRSRHSRHWRIVLAQRRPVCPVFSQAGRSLSKSPEMTKVKRLLRRIAKRTVIERLWVLLRPRLCRLRTPAKFLAAQRYVARVMLQCAIRHKVAKHWQPLTALMFCANLPINSKMLALGPTFCRSLRVEASVIADGSVARGGTSEDGCVAFGVTWAVTLCRLAMSRVQSLAEGRRSADP